MNRTASKERKRGRKPTTYYDGEMWLELDDGETLHLNRGDVVVQNGTGHAWRNKGNKPVTMLFFLNGARAREASQA